VWVAYDVGSQSPSLNVTILLYGKTATRLPEAMWLRFNPLVPRQNGWMMDKLGELVDPLTVITNGSRHLHGIGDGISYTDETSNRFLSIISFDSGLVCWGAPTPFPTPRTEPNLNLGASFALFDNIWGTNYVMWYPFLEGDGNLKFRFSISLRSAEFF